MTKISATAINLIEKTLYQKLNKSNNKKKDELLEKTNKLFKKDLNKINKKEEELYNLKKELKHKMKHVNINNYTCTFTLYNNPYSSEIVPKNTLELRSCDKLEQEKDKQIEHIKDFIMKLLCGEKKLNNLNQFIKTHLS